MYEIIEVNENDGIRYRYNQIKYRHNNDDHNHPK
jgi:hypothetical protein